MELSSIARPSSFKKGYWAYRLCNVMFLSDFHLVYAITSLQGVLLCDLMNREWIIPLLLWGLSNFYSVWVDICSCEWIIWQAIGGHSGSLIRCLTFIIKFMLQLYIYIKDQPHMILTNYLFISFRVSGAWLG